jgi:uncharacterized Zn finger protein
MKAGKDYCKCCKSKDLYDNHIDKNGYYDPNGRYVIICQDCGTIQQDYTKSKKKVK